jgi:hypothetical protein
MKEKINESLPAMIPQFPIEIAGHKLTLRFDVNINKTKKGLKCQFILGEGVPTDIREMQKIANEISVELQEKFGAANLQIMYDTENPYKNVIGFLIPLPSIANLIVNKVLKGEGDAVGDVGGDTEDSLPAKEQPGEEGDDLKELMQQRAGIKL